MTVASQVQFDPSPSGPNSVPVGPGIVFNSGTGVVTHTLPGGGAFSLITLSNPTAVAHAGSNVTAVSVTAGSDDNVGSINFTTPASLVGGSQVDITFGQRKPAVPRVIQLEPLTQALATTIGAFFVSGLTATGFSIAAASAHLTASTAYQIGYVCFS